jgi:excisionase family DNA binding protein
MTQTMDVDAKIEFRRPIEAARILRVGRHQIYQAIAAGEIRAVRIGGQFRIPEGELDRMRRGETAS